MGGVGLLGRTEIGFQPIVGLLLGCILRPRNVSVCTVTKSRDWEH